MALQQAFVDYTEGKSRFRLGRQALSFGKQRLVSPLPWGNSLRTWEGLRYDYIGDNWQTTAFTTRFVPVKKYDRNKANSQQKFSGFYANGYINQVKTDFYLFNLADKNHRDLYTLGTNFTYKTKAWDINTELAFQTGNDQANNDVSAYMLASELGFKIDNTHLKRLSIGVDYASGDDNPFDNDNNTFDQLFPLGHAYLGFADHIGRRNVMAANITSIFKVSSKVSTKVALHTFYKAEKEDAVYNAGGIAIRPAISNVNAELGSRHIANEIDVVITYLYNSHTKVHLGMSYIKASDAIDETAHNENVAFAYLSINYTF